MALPVAIGFGYLCDRTFDSTPIGLLTGTVVGFAAMLLRIVRMRPRDTQTEAGEEFGQGNENTGSEKDSGSDR